MDKHDCVTLIKRIGGLAICVLVAMGSCQKESGVAETNGLSIHGAAYFGELDIVKQICERSPEAISMRNQFGDTPLHEAAEGRQRDVVRYLLSRGADPNVCNRRQYTPLHLAALMGDVEIVRALLKAGAEVDKACCNFSEVIGEDLYRECQGVLREDLNICGPTPLEVAAMRGHLEVASLLLEKGAKTGICPDGASPLYHACTGMLAPKYQEYEPEVRESQISMMVKLLIEHGAKLDDRNNRGEAAIHIAIRLNEWETVMRLIRFGADVTVRDNNGDTALHFLARFAPQNPDPRAISVFRQLLQHGADLKAQNNRGETPIEVAKNWDHPWLEELFKVELTGSQK